MIIIRFLGKKSIYFSNVHFSEFLFVRALFDIAKYFSGEVYYQLTTEFAVFFVCCLIGGWSGFGELRVEACVRLRAILIGR